MARRASSAPPCPNKEKQRTELLLLFYSPGGSRLSFLAEMCQSFRVRYVVAAEKEGPVYSKLLRASEERRGRAGGWVGRGPCRGPTIYLLPLLHLHLPVLRVAVACCGCACCDDELLLLRTADITQGGRFEGCIRARADVNSKSGYAPLPPLWT